MKQMSKHTLQKILGEQYKEETERSRGREKAESYRPKSV